MQHNKTIRAGIIGAAGYVGGELIRLLLQHPDVTLAFAQSTSSAGKLLHEIHPDLLGESGLSFIAEVQSDCDVLFLCAGHGAARTFLETHDLPGHIRIIDLSQDFRLRANSTLKDRHFVYGLPELNSAAIRQAQHIANPGCFATALTLGLLPLAASKQLGEVFSTGITGSTGAGQSLSASSHFSWRTNNIQPYKTLQHQHLAEVHESLRSYGQEPQASVHFVPWRGDFARGIFVSSVVTCSLDLDRCFELYEAFYADAVFTHVSQTPIDLKRVVNTNKCLVHLEKSGDKLAIHSAIDNLLKGAAGQAVHNMNLLFGFAEKAGLSLKASAF